MQKKSKVLLVDDERLIRQAMAILLGTFDDIEIVGEAGDGAQAYDFCLNNEVDLVLLDIRMPGMNGIEATKLIKNFNPEIKILILTTFEDLDYISQAMNLGASGYLLKDQDYKQIHEGINTVMANNIVLDSKISKKLLEINSQSTEISEKNTINIDELGINARELEIIKLVTTGLNNQEIADELFLSLGTVKNNISNILNKLDLRNRTELVIFAFKNNLL